MGVWGPGLHQNDTADDLVHDWRTRLEAGEGFEQTTTALISEYCLHPDRVDPDDEPFWLALLDLQWKHGAPHTRAEAAVRTLWSGERMVEVWGEDARPRRRVVDGILDRIQTPHPRPKVVKVYRKDVRWPVGAVVGYRQDDGLWCLFEVVEQWEGYGAGLAPRVRVLAWWLARLPTKEEVAALRPAEARGQVDGADVLGESFARAPVFVLGTMRKGDIPHGRLKRLKGRVVAAPPSGDATLKVPWSAMPVVFGRAFLEDASVRDALLVYRRADKSSVWMSSRGSLSGGFDPDCGEWVGLHFEVYRQVPGTMSDAQALEDLPVGHGLPWRDAEEIGQAAGSLQASFAALPGAPEVEDLRARVLSRMRGAAAEGNDLERPVCTGRRGEFPRDRMSVVGFLPSVGNPNVHGGRVRPWSELDADLETWGI